MRPFSQAGRDFLFSVEFIYLEHINEYDAVMKPDLGYGDRFQITMNLVGPNGKEEPVRTGWIIDKNNGEVRLTSIYVNRRKKGKSQRKAKKKK